MIKKERVKEARIEKENINIKKEKEDYKRKG